MPAENTDAMICKSYS